MRKEAWYQGKKAVCVENCQNSESEPVKCTKIQSLYKRTLLTFCVRPMFLFLFSPFGDKLSLLFSECVIFLLSRIYNGRVQREVPRFDFLFILWKLSKIQTHVKGKSLRRKKSFTFWWNFEVMKISVIFRTPFLTRPL